ncbi:Phosphoribosylformylglycinamidine synthase 2 [Mycobacterium avium subsp. paratuberculosis]|nr:Phosphoribosylformylglycinamidine synthase 2 [Mycobacterium avium subsp. paratuberculosis]
MRHRLAGVTVSPTSAPTQAIDTVERAATTPDEPQPFGELGLKDDEYQRIREILGRRPTDTELAMYSVMWSEHCSYKSSKVHLRYFGETTTDEMRAGMLAGIGENAGVVDIGDGWAVTFKVESHNHPSYVEPYQGAATGVGGIVRDIMAMGARPVAVMDQLRFGAADAPDTRRVLDGVVRGIGGYGNSLGLPNIGGETVFDACYAGNPLVNAMCVGVLRQEDLHMAFASGTGNKIILFGARTGLDGIGGVSVLASDTFDAENSRKKLPSVQVGDPFMEKVLIECCLELYAGGLVVGIQDLGGAGLACATSELASAGDGGDGGPAGGRAAAHRRHDARGGAVQRIPGADVRGGHTGERRRLPGGVPQVGRAGHRDRRGHRRRPAADHLARADGGRRAAAHRRP